MSGLMESRGMCVRGRRITWLALGGNCWPTLCKSVDRRRIEKGKEQTGVTVTDDTCHVTQQMTTKQTTLQRGQRRSTKVMLLKERKNVPFIHPSTNRFTNPSINPSILSLVHPSIYPSIHLSIHSLVLRSILSSIHLLGHCIITSR